MSAAATTDRGITIVRKLDAPRELVFQAWTDPDHLTWYHGPGPGQPHPTTVDLRVGGAWRIHMIENEERSYTTGGVYTEIVPPEKLVFTWGAVDGWPSIDPDQPGDNPTVTVLLKDLGDATEMTFQVTFADDVTDERIQEWFALGIRRGWAETLDRLNPYLLDRD